jgi:hypothetical protein
MLKKLWILLSNTADLDPTLNFDANLASHTRIFLPLRPVPRVADPLRSPPFYLLMRKRIPLTFNFDLDEDPDPIFHSDADPCGAGSATMFNTKVKTQNSEV